MFLNIIKACPCNGIFRDKDNDCRLDVGKQHSTNLKQFKY